MANIKPVSVDTDYVRRVLRQFLLEEGATEEDLDALVLFERTQAANLALDHARAHAEAGTDPEEASAALLEALKAMGQPDQGC